MTQTDFYSPLSVKGREFLRRPVPTGLTTTSTPTVALDDDDSWIYDSIEELPKPVVASATTEANSNRGGRPKRKPSVCRVPVVVTDYNHIVPAVKEVLWRAQQESVNSGNGSQRKLTAKQIVDRMSVENVQSNRIYGVLNKIVSMGMVERERSSYVAKDGSIKVKELLWLDSKREGWYWRGKLWTERALSAHPHCKVKRTALRFRLNVQGMSVHDALFSDRTDNAKPNDQGDEWREL